MIKLYGILNCDNIKKARHWLTENNLDYQFHNYKKLAVPEKNLKRWVKQAGWDVVLNKRGTSWRKLSEKTKTTINEVSAIQLMLDNPSMIKRPVLEQGKKILIGFNEDEYKTLL